MSENRFCSCLLATSASMEAQFVATQKRAAVLNSALWDQHYTIPVSFMGGVPTLHERIAAVAREWEQHANLRFDFLAPQPGEIRIAFEPGRGSWSYLGTECRQIPLHRPTMNFGWLTPASTDDDVRRVVLHEFGHALGLIHEHQSPSKPIRWNREAVIADLGGPPNNWDIARIENNIFKLYALTAVTATPVDPDSIMMYPIPAAWTLGGEAVGLNRTLSAEDKYLIASVYP